MKKVEVLLATFQGHRFLPELLGSLEAQSEGGWRALVSDDGSSDGTVEILRGFEARSPERYVVHENAGARGAKENFAGLLRRSDADYLFFADQDDVWYPDKIAVLLGELKRLEAELGSQTPILVHCDLRLIDADGREIHPSMSRAQKLEPSVRRELRHLLVQNNVTGCAMAINGALRDLALPIPDEAIMHDWWLAIVAAAFGTIRFVPEPLVGYRQHTGNAIGAKQYSVGLLIEQMGSAQRIRRSMAATFEQAAAFLALYEEALSDQQRDVVSAFATLPTSGFLEGRRRVIDYGFWKAGLARNLGMLWYL